MNSSFNDEFLLCLAALSLFWINAALLYLLEFIVNVSAMDGRLDDEVGVQGIVESLEFCGCAAGLLFDRFGC